MRIVGIRVAATEVTSREVRDAAGPRARCKPRRRPLALGLTESFDVQEGPQRPRGCLGRRHLGHARTRRQQWVRSKVLRDATRSRKRCRR